MPQVPNYSDAMAGVVYTTGYTVLPPWTLHQYVTYQEFADAPTGLNYTNLIAGGTAQQEQAAVNKLLQRASEIVDYACRMSLHAETRTDTFRVYPDSNGNIVVVAPKFPVQSVTSLQWAYSPQSGYNTVDASTVMIDPGVFPQMVRAYGCYYAYQRLLVQMTYVAGFVCTTLTQSTNVGDTNIQVYDATGIAAGQVIPLYDSANSEPLYIASVNGDTVTLSQPLAYEHAIGCGVSLVPEDIKQATIMIATFLLNERSLGEVDMGFGSTHATVGKTKNVNEYALGIEILQRYKRVYG